MRVCTVRRRTPGSSRICFCKAVLRGFSYLPGEVCLQPYLSGCKEDNVPAEGRIGCDTDLLDVKTSLHDGDVLPPAAAEIRDIGRGKDEADARPAGVGGENRREAVFPSGCVKKGGCHLQEEGRFDERPEGRVERACDDGPRLFQLGGGLETQADDGDARRGQRLEGILREMDRFGQVKGEIIPFPKGLGEGIGVTRSPPGGLGRGDRCGSRAGPSGRRCGWSHCPGPSP